MQEKLENIKQYLVEKFRRFVLRKVVKTCRELDLSPSFYFYYW